MLNLDRSLPTQCNAVWMPSKLFKTSLTKAIKHTVVILSAALVAAPVLAACNLTAFNSKLSQTGTAPFTTAPPLTTACATAQGSFTHAPGDDPCPNDNVVRTNDTVVYQFNYKVLGNTIENNITFRSVLPQIAGKTVAVWDSLPPFCTAPTDGISADGLTLTCNVGTRNRTLVNENGDLTEGLPALAKFTIAGANGQRLQPSTTVTTDTCTAADNGGASLAPAVEISARPKVDFKKDYPWNGGQNAYTRNGVPGYLVSWYVYMDQYDPAGSSAKGGQSVNSPVTLKDVPSNFPPNAVWFDCGRSGPYQGTITCPAEGTPVVNGAQQNLVITAQASDPQEADEFLVAGGKNTLVQLQPLTGSPERMAEFYLRYFVPLSDINAAGGQINLRNDIPANLIVGTDRSGLTIVDTNSANNGLNITVVGNAPGSLRKYVTKEWSGSPWAGSVPGTAATGEIQLQGTNSYGDEGTGVTYPNQVFYPGLWYTNPSVLPVFNSIICDTFNAAEVRVANIPNFPGHGAAYRYNSTSASHGTGGPFPQGYVVEYGVAPGVQSAATSRCDDSDAVWYPTLTSAASAGAREAINKVRIKIPELASGGNAEMLIAHQARPNVNGTVIEDYMSAKGPNIGSPAGTWVLSGYDEVSNNGVVLGKRFKLTTASARIAKDASVSVGSPSIGQAGAGTTVTYTLQPSLGSVINGLPASFVTIVDELPQPFSYVVGSAKFGGVAREPDSVSSNATSTTLTWTINGLIPNTPIQPLTFQAAIPTIVAPGTVVTNTAKISSPDDVSDLSQRTATKALTILNLPGLKVAKTVANSLIDPNGTAVWKAYISNFTSTSTVVDVIDVLPYNGDGRLAPATNYAGTLNGLSTAIVPPGVGGIARYNGRVSSSIVQDPNLVGNEATTANGWCLESEFLLGIAGCPANFASVKAWRLNNVTIDANTTIAIDFSTPTNANALGNIYNNRFFAKNNDVDLTTLQSNDVRVTVALGSLSGTVYVDTDRTATQNGAADVPIAGVVITLCRVAPTAGVCAAADIVRNPITGAPITATTAADGSYKLNGVPSSPPGGYFIVETKPALYGNGPTNAAGSLGGTGSANTFSAVTVPVGANGTNYNFGHTAADLATTVTLPTTPIAPGDTVVGNVQLANLTATSGEATKVKLTLKPGLAGVAVTLPTGWVFAPGSPAGGYDPVTGIINLVPAAAGGEFPGNTAVNVGVSFTAPVSGAVTLRSDISNSVTDLTSINNPIAVTNPDTTDPTRNAHRASITVAAVAIDVTKRVGTPRPITNAERTALGVGSTGSAYAVPYRLVVSNKSVLAAPNVQLTDRLDFTFASPAVVAGVFKDNAGFSSNPGAALVAGSNANCVIAATPFNGVSQPNLLNGSFSLPPLASGANPDTAASCILEFTVVVNYAANPVPQTALKNTAFASANNNANNPGPTAFSPSGVPTFGAPGHRASDASTDSPQVPPEPYPGGTYPTAPTPGSALANEDTPDPTPVILGPPQQIDVRKSASQPVQLDVSGRRFKLGYAINIANTSATVPATNVQVSENLLFTFPAPATFVVSNKSVAGTCPLNAAFNGGLTNTPASYNLIDNGTITLNPGQSCAFKFEVVVDYGTSAVPVAAPQNRAFGSTAFGANPGSLFDATGLKTGDAPNMISKDSSTSVVPTVSTYGVAPADPGPPATPNSDVGSSTLANWKTLEVNKSVAGTVVPLGPKKFRVPYRVKVTAIGVVGEVLPNVQAIDNLVQSFSRPGGAQPSIVVTNHALPTASPAGSYCPASFTTFNGQSDQRFFAGNTALTVGQSCEFRFDVEVDYGTADIVAGPHQNSVYASSVPGTVANAGGSVAPNAAVSGPNAGPNGTYGTVAGIWTPPVGAIAIDASTDGTNVPATASADVPLPTPVRFGAAPPVLGIKYVENLQVAGAAVVSGAPIQWTIVYKNDGVTALNGVQVTDTLNAGLRTASIVSVVKQPVTVGDTLVANTTYDGTAAKNKLLSADTILLPGQSVTIKIKAFIKDDFVGTLTNQANLSATEYGGPAGTLVPTSAINPTSPACPSAQACIPAGVTVPAKALNSQPTGNTNKDQANVLSVVKGGAVAGTAWFDANSDGALGNGEARVPNLRVAVYAVDPVTGQRITEITDSTNRPITDGNGSYAVSGLPPSDANGPQYEVVFYNEAGVSVMGKPSPMAAGNPNNGQLPADGKRDRITKIKVSSGATTPAQNLPLDPSGVVYDSQTRALIPDAVVTFTGPAGFNPAIHLVGGAANVSQRTGPTGYYQYLLLDGAPSGIYSLTVAPPGEYVFRSQILPPEVGTLTPPAGAGNAFQIVASDTAPKFGSNEPTTYWLSFNLTVGVSRDVVHNHIPLDPNLPAKIALEKTVNKTVAEIGDVVTYRLRVRNVGTGVIRSVFIDDRLPRGFSYVPGTTQVALGTAALTSVVDPAGSPGPALTFAVPGTIPVNGEAMVFYKVRLGVGSLQSDGINKATARSFLSKSNEARAKVRVEAGVFTADACVAGKVFVDCNNNHIQDAEELGIPGVRLFLSDGTNFTTDSEGKYSYCGLSPKSHALRIDMLTMPRGSRLTTTSNRNLGDAGSLFLDAKNGELVRADFAEGSCSNSVLEQVKSRKAQGEVRARETEKRGQPAKKFEGKAATYPQQGTDSANQKAVVPRPATGGAQSESEQNAPVPTLPAASSNTRGDNIRGVK